MVFCSRIRGGARGDKGPSQFPPNMKCSEVGEAEAEESLIAEERIKLLEAERIGNHSRGWKGCKN